MVPPMTRAILGNVNNKCRVLIVGTVSNVSKRLQADFTKVRNSFSTDFEVFTYLVESDSLDETVQTLNTLSKSTENFCFTSLGELKKLIPDRIERIRFCRNQYVQFIRHYFETFNWDYIVVADLDGMNRALNCKAVRSCFTRFDWDCCLSNQTGGYYDIFALREGDWQPGNYFDEVESRRTKIQNLRLSKFEFINRIRLILFEDSIRWKAVYSKMKRIPRNSDWVPVDSGFGGLAIYTPRVFLNFDYSRVQNGGRDSEHVDLHFKMRKENLKIFINPNFINAKWNTYNINRYFLVRQARRIVWGNRLLYSLVRKFKTLYV